MIHVDKSRFPDPVVLTNDNANANGEKQKAINFFEGNIGQEVDFKIYSDNLVKSTLKLLFQKKCAYCESIISHVSYPHVEHWRPKGGVTGQPNHKGYYWLASEWNNLLLACSVCNGKSHKGNHFPIRRGSNYAYQSTDNLGNELPLLLNPCMETDPTRHFTYSRSGGIKGMTTEGRTSIKIYGLNR